MCLRTVTTSGREYVQLAHNTRHPVTGVSKPQILYNFGRADQLDLDALRRLARSIAKFLEPDEARQIEEELGLEVPFEYVGSRRLGGTWLLDDPSADGARSLPLNPQRKVEPVLARGPLAGGVDVTSMAADFGRTMSGPVPRAPVFGAW